MAVNVELLERTLATIKANPDHWRQSSWHCESSHCFAGFAELLHFGLPVDSDERDLRRDDRFRPDPIHGFGSYWHTQDNALDALGLDEADGIQLFDGANSLADLESMVNLLIKDGTLVDYVYNDDNDDND